MVMFGEGTNCCHPEAPVQRQFPREAGEAPAGGSAAASPVACSGIFRER